MTSKRISTLAKLALVAATVIWGAGFVVMKNALDSVPCFYLLAIRFTMGALVLTLIFTRRFRAVDRSYLLGGVIMGLFLFTAYTLQTIGLMYTTPGKNAFLTTVYCIIVPFLGWAVTKKRPGSQSVAAALICMAGVWLISVNPASEGGINIGDLLTILCGFAFACHILAVNRFRQGRDIVVLTVIQFAVTAALSWSCGGLFETFPSGFDAGAVSCLLYLGLLGTAAAMLLQNIGQKYTTPSTASLLMSLEAVFGVIFSVIFAGDQMTLRLTLGFGLIFGALVLSEVKIKKSHTKTKP